MIISVVAAGASLALAVPASAQETAFTGRTSDGAGVRLKVGEFGNATSFRVSAEEIECNHGTLSNRAFTYRDFDRSDPGSFGDRTHTSSRSGALTFKTETRLNGLAAEDFLTWTGIYKLTTKVIKKGHKIDTCKVNATWEAA